jgi:hypothetical protein
MNKQDKYLWQTIEVVACQIKISKEDYDENCNEIHQQLYAEFFIELLSGWK